LVVCEEIAHAVPASNAVLDCEIVLPVRYPVISTAPVERILGK
jgi:hypothetical protein